MYGLWKISGICGRESFPYLWKNKMQTSYAIADALKGQLGVSKFEAVIVANGKKRVCGDSHTPFVFL